MANEASTVVRPLLSDDVKITFAALGQLGFPAQQDDESFRFETWEAAAPSVPREIWVGNSGTSARFLTALAAWRGWPCRIDGVARMRSRPMKPLIGALTQLGADIRCRDDCLPFEIAPAQLRGSAVQIDASQSSQFLSALLLIAPLLPQGLSIEHGGRIASRPYARMTVEIMRRAGIELEEEADFYRVRRGQNYRLSQVEIEPDYSSASYFLAGAALSGGTVRIPGLRRDSLQGDRAILDILEHMGAQIQVTSRGVELKSAPLQGVEWDCNTCPDLVPTLAAAALFAERPSRLKNIAHLRYKESDRIQAVIENIRRLGGSAEMIGEDLHITPAPLHGARLPAYNDHRIAMSFALVGLRIPGVVIEGAESVQKSYPNFWDDFLPLIRR